MGSLFESLGGWRHRAHGLLSQRFKSGPGPVWLGVVLVGLWESFLQWVGAFLSSSWGWVRGGWRESLLVGWVVVVCRSPVRVAWGPGWRAEGLLMILGTFPPLLLLWVGRAPLRWVGFLRPLVVSVRRVWSWPKALSA